MTTQKIILSFSIKKCKKKNSRKPPQLKPGWGRVSYTALRRRLLVISQKEMEPHTVCKWCYLKTITSPQFLKVFIEFVTILLLSYVLFFWPWDIWHLNSTTRERTCTARLGRQILKHWTTREIPIPTILGPERILESNKNSVYDSFIQLTLFVNLLFICPVDRLLWPRLNDHRFQLCGYFYPQWTLSILQILSDLYQASQRLAKSPQHTSIRKYSEYMLIG